MLTCQNVHIYISMKTWGIFIRISSTPSRVGRNECSWNTAESFGMAVLTRDSEAGVPAQECDKSSRVTSLGKLKPGSSKSRMKLTCQRIPRYNVWEIQWLRELGMLKWVYHPWLAYPHFIFPEKDQRTLPSPRQRETSETVLGLMMEDTAIEWVPGF